MWGGDKGQRERGGEDYEQVEQKREMSGWRKWRRRERYDVRGEEEARVRSER